MPQLSYSGVYIQEKSSRVKTITGVATSIGAFFGRSVKGSLDKAVRCLSFADFVRNFGSPHPLSDLSNSVRQFFDNGGTDCSVVRLAHGARRAGLDLESWAGTVVLRATATMDGIWGNGVRLEVDYSTPNPGERFNPGFPFSKWTTNLLEPWGSPDRHGFGCSRGNAEVAGCG